GSPLLHHALREGVPANGMTGVGRGMTGNARGSLPVWPLRELRTDLRTRGGARRCALVMPAAGTFRHQESSCLARETAAKRRPRR
ncbi:MAG: hypothetical protein C4345_10465, partial [Chloroflexota bacterium]